MHFILSEPFLTLIFESHLRLVIWRLAVPESNLFGAFSEASSALPKISISFGSIIFVLVNILDIGIISYPLLLNTFIKTLLQGELNYFRKC